MWPIRSSRHPAEVVFPIRLCLAGVLLLTLLRANRFDIGQVAIRNSLKRRCDSRRGMNAECAQLLREGASSNDIDVFPNVKHELLITYTLALAVKPAIGQVAITTLHTFLAA